MCSTRKKTMTSKDEKGFSLLICSTLDSFGFKKEMVTLRAKCADEKSKAFDLLQQKQNLPIATNRSIIAGSSGEGVALSDSDKDVMVVLDAVVCSDKGAVNEQFTILETDFANAAPGYTKVMFVHKAGGYSILNSLVYENEYVSTKGYSYVSSATLRNNIYDIIEVVKREPYFSRRFTGTMTTNGPAMTNETTAIPHSYETDMVLAVYYYGNQHLSKWASRPRLHNWPACELVSDISEMEGYIVPVGDKQSEHQNLEWRVCYTTAEKKLVSILNSVQIKLYVLLKMVAKEILKPVCKAITSYIVKNVVFWIVERTPPQQFSPELMVNLLRASLHFMKHCLENNHFPNYMIPERDLLSGRVFGQEKQVIIRHLSECLDEGGFIVLRIPKLRQCLTQMLASPGLVIVYEKWRDELEEASIKSELQLVESVNANELFLPDSQFMDAFIKAYANIRFNDQNIKFIKLIMPELPWLIQNGRINEMLEIYYRRMSAMMLL